jgi:hypothetical protein
MVVEQKKKKGKKTSPPKNHTAGRALMYPKEWEDTSGRKVISEYHKDRIAGESQGSTLEPTTSEDEKPREDEASIDSAHGLAKSSQVFDLSTVETLAYVLSRSLFRRGVQIPLKVKDVVDMDIAVKDTDLILNTNDVSFELPPLQIWRIIFSYKGKPVFEYGRGVPNMFKIHYRHAFPFLWAMWLGGRKRRKAKKDATAKACMEVAQKSGEKQE